MPTFKWFCLALRVIGAWNVVYSLGDFVAAFNEAKGFYNPVATVPMGFVLQGFTHLIVGLLLVRFSPLFALFGYPEKAARDKAAREPARDSDSD